MTLSAHPKSKLMKSFSVLGPYLREEQCQNDYFFFDCLAICVNVKLMAEKRQFWGWWMELKFKEEGFTYSYQLGLYSKEKGWRTEKIKDPETQEALKTTLRTFHKRLHDMLITMEMTLEAAQDHSDQCTELLV
ncbi:sigma factor-binding protein Crl [Candidatus Fukatsuia symbiotica]|uniref:Sigma factor-binding protein Crl n=1 Tax=Candidatus Fukatsuia symbiotica TaxID=1878942 RepID=A0A2U8I3W3_9GAMM|nr:sigma factor-binding protein Crl [Candidatus Fukatsuia symbiotica]AWK13789.1 Crl family RNA polymerase assembly factor [Candidatus Fukatsuia symbiotica]MEA9445978.1 sigma factor-binding protein Crl [Candidatus Fukatsuia symbiotica]